MPSDCHILHLSDLHFGADHGFRIPGMAIVPGEREVDLAEAVSDDLKTQGINGVVAFVVSGDIMTHGRWLEYGDNALGGLRKLCDHLKLDPARVLIVPSNHDYEWYQLQQDEWTRRVFTPEMAVNFRHTVHFDKFLKDFYGAECQFPKVHTFKLPEYVIKIGLLDSCKVTPTKFHEYGYVSGGQIKTLISQFEDNAEPLQLRMLVLHHHLTTVLPAEAPSDKASVSVTLDAGELIDAALPAGVAFITWPSALPLRYANKKVGAGKKDARATNGKRYMYFIHGSSGVTRTRLMPHIPNTYSLITLRDQTASIRIRQIYGNRTIGRIFSRLNSSNFTSTATQFPKLVPRSCDPYPHREKETEQFPPPESSTVLLR